MATDEGVLKYLEAERGLDIEENIASVKKALEDLDMQGNFLEEVCVTHPIEQRVQETDLSELVTEISKATKILRKAEKQLKKSTKLLANPRIAEAKEQLAELDIRVKTLGMKLNLLSGNTDVISDEELSKITQEHEKLLREYYKRKWTCKRVINTIEDYPKTKKALME